MQELKLLKSNTAVLSLKQCILNVIHVFLHRRQVLSRKLCGVNKTKTNSDVLSNKRMAFIFTWIIILRAEQAAAQLSMPTSNHTTKVLAEGHFLCSDYSPQMVIPQKTKPYFELSPAPVPMDFWYTHSHSKQINAELKSTFIYLLGRAAKQKTHNLFIPGPLFPHSMHTPKTETEFEQGLSQSYKKEYFQDLGSGFFSLSRT